MISTSIFHSYVKIPEAAFKIQGGKVHLAHSSGGSGCWLWLGGRGQGLETERMFWRDRKQRKTGGWDWTQVSVTPFNRLRSSHLVSLYIGSTTDCITLQTRPSTHRPPGAVQQQKVSLINFIKAKFKSRVCHLLVVKPHAGYSASVCFHSIIHEMGLIIVPSAWGYCGRKRFNACRGCRTVPGMWSPLCKC